MSDKIYGIPVATPLNPDKVKPAGVVKSINGNGPDENGDVEIDFSETVNAALAQAKASGEFDGKDGQDGKDGKDGTNGVYIGSGDMPTGYSIQIDPNGAGDVAATKEWVATQIQTAINDSWEAKY